MNDTPAGCCPHGVPWLYVWADANHPNHEHHECDVTPRIEDLSPEQAAIVRALIEAETPAGKRPRAKP